MKSGEVLLPFCNHRLIAPMLRRSLPTMVAVVLGLGWPVRVAEAAASDGANPRRATLPEITALFVRVTRPVPARCHFRARVEIRTPAWTERQIGEEIRRQEQASRTHDRGLTAAQQRQLGALRREGVRQAHSGTSTFEVEVWLAGELYRKDEVWTSVPLPSRRSYVRIADPGFTNVMAFIANHTLESATLYPIEASQVPLDPLWEGYTLEPPLVLPLLAAVGSTNALIAPSDPSPIRPWAALGISLDRAQASRLAEGTHPTFRLEVRDSKQGEQDVRCFDLTRREGLRSPALRVQYWVDRTDPDRLRRAELVGPNGPLLVSEREGVDDSGWPRIWTTESAGEDGRLVWRQVIYDWVDPAGEFATWPTFAPEFPERYVVAASTGHGVAELVHNPAGAAVAEASLLPGKPGWPKVLLALGVGTALLVLPAVLLRRAKPASPAPARR